MNNNELAPIQNQIQNQQAIALPTNNQQITIVKVNGKESVVLIENNQLIVKPLATEITKTEEPLKIEPTIQPSRQTTYSKDDPLTALMIGFALFAASFILVCLFMPKERLPYEVVTCKPTWFLFMQTGETCQTTKGFK